MHRQLKIFSLTIFMTSFALAKPSTDSVYTVPSPPKTGTQTEDSAKNTATPSPSPEQLGLDATKEPQTHSYTSMAHLPPGDSLTLAFSRANEFSDSVAANWLGIHYVPWMDATNRVQAGVDIHDKVGWLQVAYHNLLSRNLSRFYWGGGVSVIIDSEDHFAPLVKLDNYNLFVTGGWELQVFSMQSLRLEASYHQGSEFRFLKGTAGYTFHF